MVYEKWILAVNCGEASLEAVQEQWTKYNISVTIVPTIQDALFELHRREYLLILIFMGENDILPSIQALRHSKPIPMLLMDSADCADKERQLQVLDMVRHTILPNVGQRRDEKETELFPRHIRRPCPQYGTGTALSYGELVLCIEHRKVFVRGREADLTSDQFRVLKALMDKIGHTITHEEIYQRIYGSYAVVVPEDVENAVRCHISRIRRILFELSKPTEYIQTIRGFGYKIG